ncbi:MAG: hypothetical protein AAGC60_04310 [Acidobacteriota bacterium]
MTHSPSSIDTALTSAVEELKSRLVNLAEEWVREQDAAAATTVDKSQLRLLLQAARSEPLPVTSNLLRYQIGRDNGFYGSASHRNRGRHARVGQRLLDLLETTLPELAREGIAGDAARSELERELATHFFGYVLREHTYMQAVVKERGRRDRGGNR